MAPVFIIISPKKMMALFYFNGINFSFVYNLNETIFQNFDEH